MIRLFTDFQAMGPDGVVWILKYGEDDIDKHAAELKISRGDRVVLDDYGDLEVIGILDFKYVEYLMREAWVAYPDWSTRVNKGQSD